MKNKIIGLFVCMLLIATAIPAVTSLQNDQINTATPGTSLESIAANWTETYKITAADGTVNDYFGHAISIYYDIAFIGAYNDDEIGFMAGSVYVYHQTGATWTQQTKLLASDGAANDRFGFCVDYKDDIAMIGAPGDEGYTGAVYVFTHTGNTWFEQQKLVAYDGATGDNFGCAVSLDGDTVVIGASGDDDLGTSSGSAYVYSWNGSSWIHIQKLYPSASGENFFGFSVSLSDDTVLIGAPSEGMHGFTYVFIRPGVDWILQQKFHGSSTEAYDVFGHAVCLDGDTAFIAAPWDDDQGDASGAVFIFTRDGNHWDQQAKLLASDGAENNVFGYSIAFSGDTALIGANCDDNGVSSGGVYVFTWDGANWTEQQKLLASDGAAEDNFCVSVSLEGNNAIIGADCDDDHGYNSGSAYVFSREGGAPGLTFNITGGLGVNLKITNNGTVKSTIADWQINVKGGILGKINKTINGTVDIPAGESKIVGTGLFFGLGPITIIAKVADEAKTAEGTYLFIFSIVK